ncbi:MAG: caspase family protein, partial [Methylococcaceae bacterium]
DNDTLQLMLVSGEVLDWAIAADSPKRVANIAETVAAVDTDAKSYAYVLPDGTVRVGNGQGHVLLSLNNKENPFKDAMLLEGDKKMLTVMDNGELSLWDVASGRKLLRLFSTQQGWTVMDAYGRFDGSEDAMENFSWAANEVDIPLDSFSENYYEPGLLTNVLQNQDYLNDNPNMVKNGITLPPKVVLQLAEQQEQADSVTLQLDIFDRGGGIDTVHVYQNGKLLNNEAVVASQQITEENKVEHRALTLKVSPGPGKNTLKVSASNDMGIENSSTELSFDGKSKAYASSMRLLTIGIDKYSDPKLNLEYSVSDADSIGLAVKNNSKIASLKSLYNEEATKPRILAELKQLSQGAQQDVLVIYFAGHGMAVGKEWYFLPYETKMQPTVEQIAATGITATELSDIFKDSKIQHILLMVDSCYSGAGMDAFSKLQIGQHYFTRKLSRSLGITVITSATKDQEAYELKSLGHGLFTYLMAQDLQNKEASQPLTAHGIAENIVKTLPVFSKKMVGASQEPVVYTKGNDFVLTDAKVTLKPAVPSSSKEPAQ